MKCWICRKTIPKYEPPHRRLIYVKKVKPNGGFRDGTEVKDICMRCMGF